MTSRVNRVVQHFARVCGTIQDPKSEDNESLTAIEGYQPNFSKKKTLVSFQIRSGLNDDLLALGEYARRSIFLEYHVYGERLADLWDVDEQIATALMKAQDSILEDEGQPSYVGIDEDDIFEIERTILVRY